MNSYSERLAKVWDWMHIEGITLLVLEDTETRRDLSIRWLTGHPGDALLILSSVDRKAVLVAWDVNLAKIYACRSPVTILPYKDYECIPAKAIAAVAKLLNTPAGQKIEIPSVTPYPAFLNFVGDLENFDIICRDRGAAAELRKYRAVKDDEEIAIIREAASITNDIIDLFEYALRQGRFKTEADAAMYICNQARKMECEGTSFETLAAGPERSYAIHAFPSCTDSPFATQGLSILDFGVRYNGYCTDVTITITRDLNPKQEKLVSLVEKAWKIAHSAANNGTPTRDIASAVKSFFGKSKKQMPHGLGHGVGLQEHEYPVIRDRSDNEWVLEPGMVFSIEPGLYDPVLGGCRLENLVLMTDMGPEVITSSRIIRL